MPDALGLLLVFAHFGLLSFGGALGILPEIERELVLQRAWLEPRTFSDGYALAQFSPGPNMLAVVFYGFKLAGLPGALGAFVGMFAGGAVLTVLMARIWGNLNDAPWPNAVRRALMPIGAGLAAGGTLSLARSAILEPWTALLAAAVCLLLVSNKFNPLLLIFVAGLLGALVGLVNPALG